MRSVTVSTGLAMCSLMFCVVCLSYDGIFSAPAVRLSFSLCIPSFSFVLPSASWFTPLVSSGILEASVVVPVFSLFVPSASCCSAEWSVVEPSYSCFTPVGRALLFVYSLFVPSASCVMPACRRGVAAASFVAPAFSCCVAVYSCTIAPDIFAVAWFISVDFPSSAPSPFASCAMLLPMYPVWIGVCCSACICCGCSFSASRRVHVSVPAIGWVWHICVIISCVSRTCRFVVSISCPMFFIPSLACCRFCFCATIWSMPCV